MSEETKTWKYVVTHDCDQFTSFNAARSKLEELTEKNSTPIQSGPLSADGPNVIRFSILRTHVIVGVLFSDHKTLFSVTAPASMAWAESMVRSKAETMIKDLLKQAGATFAWVEPYG